MRCISFIPFLSLFGLGRGSRYGSNAWIDTQITTHKELSKQEQVTSVHDKGGRVVFVTQMTRFTLAHGNKGTGNRDTNTHDHLRNLCRRDHHWWQPFWFAVTGHEAVVKIHNGVDAIVHHHEKDTRRTCCHIGMPAIEQDCNMMVPMQENQFLLVNDNEKRVHQFRKLGKNKELYPQTRRSATIRHLRIPTQVFLQSVRPQVVYQLRKGPQETHQGK
mmetsp:Transcript_8248/g.16576  ORF Transcript_8248/g.16576 Transcript_8248/m.16576 type:complete len:217 (-) Transcript_8248:413-1063(-)